MIDVTEDSFESNLSPSNLQRFNLPQIVIKGVTSVQNTPRRKIMVQRRYNPLSKSTANEKGISTNRQKIDLSQLQSVRASQAVINIANKTQAQFLQKFKYQTLQSPDMTKETSSNLSLSKKRSQVGSKFIRDLPIDAFNLAQMSQRSKLDLPNNKLSRQQQAFMSRTKKSIINKNVTDEFLKQIRQSPQKQKKQSMQNVSNYVSRNIVGNEKQFRLSIERDKQLKVDDAMQKMQTKYEEFSKQKTIQINEDNSGGLLKLKREFSRFGSKKNPNFPIVNFENKTKNIFTSPKLSLQDKQERESSSSESDSDSFQQEPPKDDSPKMLPTQESVQQSQFLNVIGNFSQRSQETLYTPRVVNSYNNQKQTWGKISNIIIKRAKYIHENKKRSRQISNNSQMLNTVSHERICDDEILLPFQPPKDCLLMSESRFKFEQLKRYKQKNSPINKPAESDRLKHWQGQLRQKEGNNSTIIDSRVQLSYMGNYQF